MSTALYGMMDATIVESWLEEDSDALGCIVRRRISQNVSERRKDRNNLSHNQNLNLLKIRSHRLNQKRKNLILNQQSQQPNHKQKSLQLNQNQNPNKITRQWQNQHHHQLNQSHNHLNQKSLYHHLHKIKLKMAMIPNHNQHHFQNQYLRQQTTLKNQYQQMTLNQRQSHRAMKHKE